MPYRNWCFAPIEARTSASLEQLVQLKRRVPVLIYERIRTRQYLHFIRRYKKRLLFVGRLTVSEILLLGLNGFWFLSGTKYDSPILQGLLSLLTTAKLDDGGYKVTDWFQKKGQLTLYLINDP
jgi:hypothetical protein